MEMDTDEALHHLCHRFSGAYEKRDSEKNRKRTRQGFTSLTPQFQWRVSWEREEEAGGEVGKTMVSRSDLQCGEDDDIELSAKWSDKRWSDEIWITVKIPHVSSMLWLFTRFICLGRGRKKLDERGCVDVIGVDGSCMDVVIVDMRLGIKEEEAGREVGTTMVSRSEFWCGEDNTTSSSRNVDKGCVGVIGVDDSYVDVVVVVMRLGVKCEMVR
ncbi:hypothetical protein IGI04_016393 [Brassica rapa subsp. trilocularis]|uniref:Uncharacterized protein n=1 Tax=Brassica rapa subsp. trilocularis TaxID=1813537 RepID=A0ABQ7MVA0_BRACM|nr:hypothetical protein IGI04_016393 [Brassica rapa subsp. trilocularis]